MTNRKERLQVEHQRQKDFYDEQVYGKPFEVGDMVWVHSPAVPRGRSKKLHHYWSGPFQVSFITQLEDNAS